MSLIGRDVSLYGGLSGPLQVEVDSRLDPEAALEQESLPNAAAGPEGRVVQEPPADLFDEVACRVPGLQPGGVLLEARRVGHRGGMLLVGDELIGQHAVQHHMASAQALGIVDVRVVAAG